MSIALTGRSSKFLVAAAIPSLVLMLSACGSSSLSPSAPAGGSSTPAVVQADPALNAKLPDKIKQAGVIQIGTDATYKPNEYMNGTTVVGMDVDLFDAVAAKLGVKTNWNPAKFDSILIGITAAKYDIGVSSFTINSKRLQAVTMISYANVGTQWASPAGNPKGVDKDNPCGKTIAIQTGTVQDDEIAATNKDKCASDPINVLSYAGQDEVNNAVAIGKADAMLADYPVTQSAIQTSGGKLVALGDQYGAAPYGYAVTKENQSFADAIAGALTELKKDGTYDAILKKYGIEAASISTFEVNPKV